FELAEKELAERLAAVPGARVERKLFAIAIHYRNAAEADVEKVNRIAGAVLAKRKGLKKASGKKIIELRPDIDWDKGRAVKWLLDHLGLNGGDTVPVYIGDDITDEDAFRMMREIGGTGILVGDHGGDSLADYRLENPDETTEFLRRMIARLQE